MADKSYVASSLPGAQLARWAPVWALALLTLALTIRAGVAHGETIVTDDQVSVVQSDVARPSRGMTMQKVESKFGAPAERHPAVGTPAITRWDYPSFSVFFENDRVIDAVVTPAS